MSERRFRLTPGGVSSVGLLVVWCPMYRRRIVGGRVVRRLSAGLEGSLTSAAGKSWLRQCCPTTRPCLCEWARPSVVRALIGGIARVLGREFPRPHSHAMALWSPSYFAASDGYVSESRVRRDTENRWKALTRP